MLNSSYRSNNRAIVSILALLVLLLLGTILLVVPRESLVAVLHPLVMLLLQLGTHLAVL